MPNVCFYQYVKKIELTLCQSTLKLCLRYFHTVSIANLVFHEMQIEQLTIDLYFILSER